MRLTKFSDYAIRVLLYAASRPGTLVTIEETADVFGISRAHLKKVVLLLSNNGYLRAVRGRRGGFTLGRAPDEINLGALLRLTEPDFAMVECFQTGNRCPITRVCRLPEVVNEALGAYLAAFDRRSLADILLQAPDFIANGPTEPALRGPRLPPVGAAMPEPVPDAAVSDPIRMRATSYG